MPDRSERPYLAILPALACALVALVFFGWLAREVFAGQSLLLDSAVRRAVQSHATPALTRFMLAVTSLGYAPPMVAFGAVLVAAFVRLGWRRAALLFCICSVGGFVLDMALKTAFHRARPLPFFGLEAPHSYSFPSGHALLGVCVYGVATMLLAERTGPGWRRRLLLFTGALLVALLGWSRIYLGVHYPSDVLAGYSAALTWVALVSTVDRITRRRSATSTPSIP